MFVSELLLFVCTTNIKRIFGTKKYFKINFHQKFLYRVISVSVFVIRLHNVLQQTAFVFYPFFSFELEQLVVLASVKILGNSLGAQCLQFLRFYRVELDLSETIPASRAAIRGFGWSDRQMPLLDLPLSQRWPVYGNLLHSEVLQVDLERPGNILTRRVVVAEVYNNRCLCLRLLRR